MITLLQADSVSQTALWCQWWEAMMHLRIAWIDMQQWTIAWLLVRWTPFHMLHVCP